MKFCALASGSSGNCFFVKKEDTAALIDAGISAKQIVERLAVIGESPETIKGIFVTHEHVDHIRGIDVFASRYNTPVYLTRKTSKSAFVCRDEKLLNMIKGGELVKVGGLNVEAFSKSHDAAEPVSYSIATTNNKLSVITDIGYACKNVVEHVSSSDSVILESNYDVDMLENGPYPAYLKQRIDSELGHISNYNAALLVLQHASKNLQNVMLSHLSINNNTPDVALRTFNLLKERKDIKPKVCVSVREKPSDYISLK